MSDPDLGKIGPGHVCKHGIRWPHECDPCADAAWAASKGWPQPLPPAADGAEVERRDINFRTATGNQKFGPDWNV